jgi:hypothetical protein
MKVTNSKYSRYKGEIYICDDCISLCSPTGPIRVNKPAIVEINEKVQLCVDHANARNINISDFKALESTCCLKNPDKFSRQKNLVEH